MATHTITLAVTVEMDEMDGTPEQSAEIALDLVSEALATHWDADADVQVDRYRVGLRSSTSPTSTVFFLAD